MRGLLLKDFLVIQKQTKIYFILMVVFALVPGLGTFSIFFGALLPITAFAYDERSHWDNVARMMPYDSRDVVAEKYVLGYLLVGSVVLLETAAQSVYCLSGMSSLSMWESMALILIPAVAALCVMALQIPVIFWIGVEKSRLFWVFATVLIMMSLQTELIDVSFGVDNILLEWNFFVVLAAAVILQVVSWRVSEKLYYRSIEKKR